MQPVRRISTATHGGCGGRAAAGQLGGDRVPRSLIRRTSTFGFHPKDNEKSLKDF